MTVGFPTFAVMNGLSVCTLQVSAVYFEIPRKAKNKTAALNVWHCRKAAKTTCFFYICSVIKIPISQVMFLSHHVLMNIWLT